MRTVPFENIDPMPGLVRDLSADEVFRKLVQGGRSDYCYELNGLLGAVLKDMASRSGLCSTVSGWDRRRPARRCTRPG